MTRNSSKKYERKTMQNNYRTTLVTSNLGQPLQAYHLMELNAKHRQLLVSLNRSLPATQ